jgi:hypothetical protein
MELFATEFPDHRHTPTLRQPAHCRELVESADEESPRRGVSTSIARAGSPMVSRRVALIVILAATQLECLAPSFHRCRYRIFHQRGVDGATRCDTAGRQIEYEFGVSVND